MKFDMDQSLGFVLNKAALFSKSNFNVRIKRFGISPEQWTLLFRIVKQSGLSQKELADSTYKDQANIGRILERLEAKGLLSRSQSESDRRSILLYPTQRAIDMAKELSVVSENFNQEMTKDFTQEEYKELIYLLKKVKNNLTTGDR